jgi:hypothetical protein
VSRYKRKKLKDTKNISLLTKIGNYKRVLIKREIIYF